jgi:hypothetical protein
VIPLGYAFPDELHNLLQLLDRTHDPALNQLELRPDRRAQLLHRGLVLGHVANRVRRVRVLPNQVVLARNGVEERGKVRGEARAIGEER